MFDFETDYIQKTNGFLKWTVMHCSFGNLFLIPEQNIRISQLPYHNASLICLLAAERPKTKQERKKTTWSKIMVFTVFQNTATAVNHNISSKQMTPERLLSAECS